MKNRSRVTYKPSHKGVSSVRTDVLPEPQKDDPEEPSRWERHPGFSKFSNTKKTYKNVPVKFVKSTPGGKETFELQTVSVDVVPDIDVDQPDADKKWERYPGQAQRRVPQVVQQKTECVPCRRKQVQSVTTDVTPPIQRDQPEEVKKWERFPNGRPQHVQRPQRQVREARGEVFVEGDPDAQLENPELVAAQRRNQVMQRRVTNPALQKRIDEARSSKNVQAKMLVQQQQRRERIGGRGGSVAL